ncbi:MAG: hypothetical protein EZS28_038373 [Streblomastix strix]|uniref:Uncharacterized protein n=1 Tax=Streblomastix strix TaxID=222440 RepID=A0A5J4U765_9EUKA|nr:MAG: hypothetical protein EZS28_038373 [Streblomastix strix]
MEDLNLKVKEEKFNLKVEKEINDLKIEMIQMISIIIIVIMDLIYEGVIDAVGRYCDVVYVVDVYEADYYNGLYAQSDAAIVNGPKSDPENLSISDEFEILGCASGCFCYYSYYYVQQLWKNVKCSFD